MLFVFLVLAAFMIAVSLWGRFNVSRFLNATPAMHDSASLLTFKVLVRRQMIGAIAGMVIGGLFGITGALLAWQLGLIGVIVVGVVAVPIFLLGSSSKKLEVQARSLPCLDAQLEPEYIRVGKTWTSKLFPDF